MPKKEKLKLALILFIIIAATTILFTIPIKLGLDLQGGTQLVLEAKETSTQKIDNETIQGVMSVIRNRIDGLGISEPIISQKGFKQIIVQLPGVKDPEHAIKMVGETAQLEFVEGEWAPGDVSKLTPEKLQILAGTDAKIDKVISYDNQGKVTSERAIILKTTALTGKDLQSASPGNDQNGNPIVNIEFTKEGAKKFQEVTRRNTGKPLAIILDHKIISAPNINEEIAGGRAQISGHFSVQEMRDLVIKLKAGALPVPVEIVSHKVVGPTLGKDSIEKSKIAGAIGTLVVLLFMFFLYRIPGIAANIALLIYILISFAILKLLHATLTLPGLAGFMLTIGIAVDANVLIFERIKEERAQGQSLQASIQHGFSRARVSILDSNITTLIGAAALFALGTGSIKGFAVTLSVGILVSMFTAITVTRVILNIFVRNCANEDRIFKGQP